MRFKRGEWIMRINAKIVRIDTQIVRINAKIVLRYSAPKNTRPQIHL
jgi:hypothetical protein